MEQIARLYLAGGFGSYIDKRNACRIGLIPAKLQHRIVAMGNVQGLELSFHYCLMRNMKELP